MQSFLISAVNFASKIKNKIQFAGLLVAVAGFIATRIVAPELVLSQIAGGSIGLLVLIFGLSLSILNLIPIHQRTLFFLTLFILTISLIVGLTWFTIDYIKHKQNEDNIQKKEIAMLKIYEKERKDSITKQQVLFDENKRLAVWFNTNVDLAGQELNLLNFQESEIPTIIGQKLDFYLIMAIESRSHEIVRILLKRGADPNSEPISYLTPLIAASRIHDLGMVELLLRSGADPNRPNSGGNYPIHQSDYYPRLNFTSQLLDENLIIILLKSGANIDTKDATGGTLLTKASWKTCEGTRSINDIKLLIKNGADLKIRDASGNNSLDYLQKCKSKISGLNDIIKPAS